MHSYPGKSHSHLLWSGCQKHRLISGLQSCVASPHPKRGCVAPCIQCANHKSNWILQLVLLARERMASGRQQRESFPTCVWCGSTSWSREEAFRAGSTLSRTAIYPTRAGDSGVDGALSGAGLKFPQAGEPNTSLHVERWGWFNFFKWGESRQAALQFDVQVMIVRNLETGHRQNREESVKVSIVSCKSWAYSALCSSFFLPVLHTRVT